MIIGTAGHIDHGKSALVRALTGQEMDRLAEERRRGITIDLNFAPLVFPGLAPVGIVDVPGHEDFVRTMVAGASGIELVLLVIDAGEGPRPQTLEHLAIVEQLGVPRGIPIFTKCDLVEPEWLDLVEAEFEDRLAASSVEFGPPMRVSAVSGQGIPELRAQLLAAIQSTTARRPADLFRLPVDRVFSMAGVGTVLTGTAWSGAIHVGEGVRLLPSGQEGRVRSVANHGQDVAEGLAGMRVAIGVSGLDRSGVRRGETLVAAADFWQATDAMDVQLQLLPDAPRPLVGRMRVRLHLGTAEVMARAYPRAPIPPGAAGVARLALETPLLARGQDRFVLRSYSPVTTIGGGVVLDPLPPRKAAWPVGLSAAGAADRLLALLARRGNGVDDGMLPQLLGLPPAETQRLAIRTSGVRRIGNRWVESARVRALEAEATAALEGHHRGQPGEVGLSLGTLRQQLRGPEWLASAALESLQKRGELEVQDGLARLAGFHAVLPGGESVVERTMKVLTDAGLAPPTVAELQVILGVPSLESVLKLLVKAGRVERVSLDRYFATGGLDRFLEAVRAVAGVEGEVAPAALRERLGVSRKFLIPLLEWSDRRGMTRREGDRRVLVTGR